MNKISIINCFVHSQDKLDIKKKGQLSNLFETFHFAVHIIQQSLLKFISKKYNEFDALVGENACQLRAKKILDLIQNLNDNQIEKCLKQSENFMKIIKKHKLNIIQFIQSPFKKWKVGQFCREHNMQFQINHDILFIALSYCLTLSKTRQTDPIIQFKFKQFTDPHKFSQLLKQQQIHIKPNKLSDHLKKIQKILASLSVQYIRKQSKQIIQNSETKTKIIQILQNKCIQDDQNRMIVPCFYNIQTCLKSIIQKQQLILIKNYRYNTQNTLKDTIQILYKVNNNKILKMQQITQQYINKPVMIFEGYTNYQQHTKLSQQQYKQLINSYNIYDIILAYAANHPQYPTNINKYNNINININININNSLEFDERREKYNNMAIQLGIIRMEGKLFVIDHIYVDTIKRKKQLRIQNIMQKQHQQYSEYKKQYCLFKSYRNLFRFMDY